MRCARSSPTPGASARRSTRCSRWPATRSTRPPAASTSPSSHASSRTSRSHAPADLPMAEGDPDIVRRALMPLVDNARRYARTAVRVELDADERRVRLTVLDDGPGVDPGLGDRVFDPGVRGEDDHPGAGLGLPLARRLARSCGGDVRLSPGPARRVRPRAAGAARPGRHRAVAAAGAPGRGLIREDRAPRRRRGFGCPISRPERNFDGGRRFPAPDAARRLRPPHARPRRRAAGRRDARRRPVPGAPAHRRAVRALVGRGLPRAA